MTGDQADCLARLKRLLPPWFGDGATPILDGVLAGPAATLAFIYALVAYVRLQLRLASATDGFLDLIATDYFGSALLRMAGELDAAYRARISSAFWPARNTRPALISALTALGLSVRVVEPWNPSDTGVVGPIPSMTAYGTEGGFAFETEDGRLLLLDGASISGLAWNTIGVWGSRTMPFQCFAIVTRPAGSAVSNAQIYAAIEAVRPLAIKVWTQIIG